MLVLLFDLLINLFVSKWFMNELELTLINKEFVTCSAVEVTMLCSLNCRNATCWLVNINEHLDRNGEM